MSDPAPDAPAPAAADDVQKVENVLTSVATGLGKALPAIELIATALAPEAAGAIATAVAIGKGVAAGVPAAVALLEQFQSGSVPTQADLDAYVAQESTAYEQLMADITAKETT